MLCASQWFSSKSTFLLDSDPSSRHHRSLSPVGAVFFCQHSPRGSTAHWTEDSLFMALLSAQRHLTVVLPIVLLSGPAFFPVPLSAFYGTSRPAPHTSQKTRAARESLPGQKPRSSISKFLFVSNSSARSCGSHGLSGMTSVPSLILLVPHHQATQVPAFSCVSVA